MSTIICGSNAADNPASNIEHSTDNSRSYSVEVDRSDEKGGNNTRGKQQPQHSQMQQMQQQVSLADDYVNSASYEVKEQDALDTDYSHNVVKSRKYESKKAKKGFKGVFKCGKKFKAQIQMHRVQHYLGLFDTEEQAARAYDNYARVVLGPKAKTNFQYSEHDRPNMMDLLAIPMQQQQQQQQLENYSASAATTSTATATALTVATTHTTATYAHTLPIKSAPVAMSTQLKQEPYYNSTTDESQLAGKRQYMGIKIKRERIANMSLGLIGVNASAADKEAAQSLSALANQPSQLPQTAEVAAATAMADMGTQPTVDITTTSTTTTIAAAAAADSVESNAEESAIQIQMHNHQSDTATATAIADLSEGSRKRALETATEVAPRHHSRRHHRHRSDGYSYPYGFDPYNNSSSSSSGGGGGYYPPPYYPFEYGAGPVPPPHALQYAPHYFDPREPMPHHAGYPYPYPYPYHPHSRHHRRYPVSNSGGSAANAAAVTAGNSSNSNSNSKRHLAPVVAPPLGYYDPRDPRVHGHRLPIVYAPPSSGASTGSESTSSSRQGVPFAAYPYPGSAAAAVSHPQLYREHYAAASKDDRYSSRAPGAEQFQRQYVPIPQHYRSREYVQYEPQAIVPSVHCTASTTATMNTALVPSAATTAHGGQPVPLPYFLSAGVAAAAATTSTAASATSSDSAAPVTTVETQLTAVESEYSEGDGDESEGDWRDQLYYWTGVLVFDPKQSHLLWKGAWVGSFTGKPRPDEFASSRNHFEYTSDRLDQAAVQLSSGVIKPVSGYFKGYYMMDNDGSGDLDEYLDNEYYVDFEARSEHYYSVVGKGDSDFGAFIVTGSFNAVTKVLEMTRQYIADSDVRCSMDIVGLKALASANK